MNGQFWVGPTSDPDKFRLGPAAASGAEGVLYKAYIDTEGGPLQIALKMLHPSHLENLGAWRDRWRELVEMLARVQVPGLVAVRGGFVGPLPHLHGQAEKSVTSLYLCMDWVEGVPLDRWARSVDNATPEQLLGALVPVASALDLLHSGAATGGEAVVHRDVKPANILIRPAGDTVLVDVGSMRGLATEARRSGVVGTPGYIAPEVRRDSAYSPASDRFALGGVAFFLMTGNEPPTEGGIDELRRRLESAPLLADRSDVVDHVVDMLNDDPDRRPSSLANWVAQLRRSSLGVLPGDVTAVRPRAPTRQPQTRGIPRPHPRSRRRSSAQLAAVGVAIIVVASSLAFASSRVRAGSGGAQLTSTRVTAPATAVTESARPYDLTQIMINGTPIVLNKPLPSVARLKLQEVAEPFGELFGKRDIPVTYLRSLDDEGLLLALRDGEVRGIIVGSERSYFNVPELRAGVELTIQSLPPDFSIGGYFGQEAFVTLIDRGTVHAVKLYDCDRADVVPTGAISVIIALSSESPDVAPRIYEHRCPDRI